MREPGRIIVITGKSRVGKTTVVRKTCERLAQEGVDLWGFTTEEIAGSGRAGLHVLTFEGIRIPFAHVQMPRGPRVGPYRVDVSAFETAVLTELVPPNDLDGFPTRSVGVFDQIDKFTCLSKAFVNRIEELLESPAHLLIVVSGKGEGLATDLRKLAGDDLIEVVPANRDMLPDIITDTFLAYMQG